MATDNTASVPKFDTIRFHHEHQSACDLDTHCPICSSFYISRSLVVSVGVIVFVSAYLLQMIQVSHHVAVTVALFLMQAFFFVSVLRNRPYELLMLTLSSLGVFVLFSALRHWKLLGLVPIMPLVVLGTLALFTVITLAGWHGISDSSTRAGQETVSLSVILIVAANLIVTFLYWTFRLINGAADNRSEVLLVSMTSWLVLVRWISLALIVTTVIVYVFFTAARQKLRTEKVAAKTKDLQGHSGIRSAFDAISNLLAYVGAAIQNAWRTLKDFVREMRRALMHVCRKSLERLVAVLVRLFRQALILAGLSTLAVSSVILAREVATLWDHQGSTLGPVFTFWPKAAMLVLLIVALSTAIGGLSFKSWSTRPRQEGVLLPELLAAAVGSTEEWNIAMHSLVFSAVWFLFYAAVSVWGAWFTINIVAAVVYKGIPRTLGPGFIGASVLLVLLLWRLRPVERAKPENMDA